MSAKNTRRWLQRGVRRIISRLSRTLQSILKSLKPDSGRYQLNIGATLQVFVSAAPENNLNNSYLLEIGRWFCAPIKEESPLLSLNAPSAPSAVLPNKNTCPQDFGGLNRSYVDTPNGQELSHRGTEPK